MGGWCVTGIILVTLSHLGNLALTLHHMQRNREAETLEV